MPKALVIDDQVPITALISQFLDDAGFETEIATSGPEGLQKATSTQPHVIMLDIMMPEMDGYEVCRQLRRDPRTARALIVALTARGQPVDKQAAFRAGADAHVAKPFKGHALIQEIQQLLADRTCTESPLGYQILVLRLKEMAGATTLATNLALCLAEEEGCLTLIADLALQGGAVDEHLGLSATGSWLGTSLIDSDELVACLVHHNSGLFVLPAPSPLEEGRVAPATVSRLLQPLRTWHDYVVLDTPLNLGPLAPTLLRSSSLVLLVLPPDLAALRQARASLTALHRSGDSSLRVWPVLNMVHPDQQALQEQAEQMWGMPVAGVLPWLPDECNQAIANHKPVVLGQPKSPLAMAIRALAQQIVEMTVTQKEEDVPG
jgi:CheY-like chemotaxis protein/MinD-like ATPase involved in chromosome partitioning or flagellar assembly